MTFACCWYTYHVGDHCIFSWSDLLYIQDGRHNNFRKTHLIFVTFLLPLIWTYHVVLLLMWKWRWWTDKLDIKCRVATRRLVKTFKKCEVPQLSTQVTDDVDQSRVCVWLQQGELFSDEYFPDRSTRCSICSI